MTTPPFRHYHLCTRCFSKTLCAESCPLDRISCDGVVLGPATLCDTCKQNPVTLELLQKRALYAEIALGDARSKLSEHTSPLRLTVEILAEIQTAINEAHDYVRGRHDHLFLAPSTQPTTEPNRDEATL